MSPRNHTAPPRSQIFQNTAGQESGGVGAGRLGVRREATVGNFTLNGRSGEERHVARLKTSLCRVR